MQNQAWSRMVASETSCIPSFYKGIATHSTLDNNDGQQETMTGSGTTHDTNITMFQLPTKNEKEELIPISAERSGYHVDINELTSVEREIPPYSIGKRVGPPLFRSYSEPKNDLIKHCFDYDIAWSIAGAMPSNFDNNDLALIGSWTSFKKLTTNVNIEQCIQEYLPVIPSPPEYPVCKQYLDNLIEMINDLEISHIYVHADEAVYSKLCHILWKNPEIYKSVVMIMGGFHQLRVKQRLLYKRFHCLGIKQWCVDAGIIASGSADQSIEARHYYRCMRLHKEAFDALIQNQFETVTGL